MKINFLPFLVFILFINSCSTTIPDTTEQLFEYYKKYSEDKLGVPLSGAFLVMDSTEVLYKNTYGVTHPDSATEINGDTKFYIGSVSKQFTALLILQLAEENLVQLNVPISNYLSDYRRTSFDSITIHQLLSHTSGLPHYPELLKMGFSAETFLRSPVTVNEYVKLIKGLHLKFEPGTGYHYSSFGYDLLGAIIEKVTTNSFSEELKIRITDPLGMDNTGYNPEHLTYGFAEDYRLMKDGFFSKTEAVLIPERALSNAYAAGGIYSSIDDLAKWIIALKKDVLLSEEMQNLMFNPVKNGATYGLFRNEEEFLRDDLDAQLISHGGEIMGYKSVIAMYDDGITIVALFNTSPLKRIVRFVNQVHLSTLNRSERKKPFIHPSLSNRSNFEEEGGIKAFEEYHNKLSERAGYRILPSNNTIAYVLGMYLEDGNYNQVSSYFEEFLSDKQHTSEAFLNSLGYTFMEYGKFDLAIKFLEKNNEFYPESANTFDSLGEVYEQSGNLEKAREYYLKAVELSRAKYGEYANESFQKNLDRLLSE